MIKKSESIKTKAIKSIKRIIANNFKYIIGAMVAVFSFLLYTIAQVLLVAEMERFGFILITVDEYGNETHSSGVLGLVVVLFLFLVILLLNFILSRGSGSDEKKQLAMLQYALELEREILVKKCTMQLEMIRNCIKSNEELPKVFTRPQDLLNKAVKELHQVVFKILKQYDKKTVVKDVPISLAYLFNPPSEPDDLCSQKTKNEWMWFHSRGKRANVSELRKYAGAPDNDGRQSAMRVALRAGESLCVNKIEASESNQYIRSSYDPDSKLSGSIYCHPFMDNGKEPTFAATVSISTHRTLFAKNDKSMEEVKWCLDVLTGAIENKLRVELLNLYISQCGTSTDPDGEDENEVTTKKVDAEVTK